jgi:hypothetical protein
VLQVAPSAYRRHTARQRDPGLRSARAKRDAMLMPEIVRVWQANLRVYGADKVWKQVNREAVPVARWTVERICPGNYILLLPCPESDDAILSSTMGGASWVGSSAVEPSGNGWWRIGPVVA